MCGYHLQATPESLSAQVVQHCFQVVAKKSVAADTQIAVITSVGRVGVAVGEILTD